MINLKVKPYFKAEMLCKPEWVGGLNKLIYFAKDNNYNIPDCTLTEIPSYVQN